MPMTFVYSPYLVPLFLAAVLSVGVFVYVLPRRRAPGATALALIAAAIPFWSIGYALEIASVSLADKMFWGKVQYVGIVFVPYFWALFAWTYTRQQQVRNWLPVLIPLIVPVTTLILAFTTERHGLIWGPGVGIEQIGTLSVLSIPVYGAWFWVHFAFSYLLLLGGTARILWALPRMKGLYRGQATILALAVLIPLIANILYFIPQMNPIPGLDLTPFAFGLTVTALAWAVWGYRLTDIAPIARDLVLENLSDGVIVLDKSARIVDINPAAAQMLGLPIDSALGKKIQDALAPFPHIMPHFAGMIEGRKVICVGEGEARCFYDVQVTPLIDRQGNRLGRLVVIREVKSTPMLLHTAETEISKPTDAAPQAEPQQAAFNWWSWLHNFFWAPVKPDLKTPPNVNPAWEQTRERAFTVMMRIAAMLGTIALLLMMDLRSFETVFNQTTSIFTLIILVFWILGWLRNLAFLWRSGGFVALVYLLALTEVMNYGYSVQAFTFFMAFVVIAAVLIDVGGWLTAEILSVLTLTILGVAIANGQFVPFVVGGSPDSLENVQNSLVAFIASSIAVGMAVVVLMRGLSQAWQKESQARNLLQQERDLLEQRVIEQTQDLIKARDDALRQSGELRKYFQAIEQSGSNIVITNVKGNIEYVNPHFEKTTGYTRAEAIGKNPRILKSGKQSLEFYRDLWKTIANGQVWQGEFQNRRKDGSLYWEAATIAPVKNSQGKIVSYVAVKDDITQQKLLREQLQRQNEYLSVLQQITFDLLNRQNLNDLLNAIVDRACALLDAPLGEIMLKEGEYMVVRAFTANQPYLLGDKVSRNEAKIIWQAHDTRQPVILENYSALFEHRNIYDPHPVYAIADFPILTSDECIGVLALGRTQPDYPFTPQQVEVGKLFARTVALVLDNARLYNAAQQEIQQRKQAQLLLEMNIQEQQALAQILELGLRDAPLETILTCALDTLLTIQWLSIETKGGIFLADPAQKNLVLTVQRNLAPQICSLCAIVDFGHCLCGRAALSRQLQFSAHVDHLHETSYEGMVDHGHYNVPIVDDQQVLGVIVLYLPPGYTYNTKDVHFLSSYANILSSIIRHKRVEMQLRESENRFRQIVENAGDIIYRTDVQGRIIYVNPVGVHRMGYETEAQLLGKSAFDFAAPEWRKKIRHFYLQQLKQRQLNTYFEFKAYNHVGDIIWIGQNVQLLCDNQKPIGFQAVAHDITNLKQALEALELSRNQALEASRFKSQLLARVSHELRTPLSAMLGYAELLTMDDFGKLNTEQQEIIQQIIESGHYLTKLINDLLDQAQAESQSIRLHIQPFMAMELLVNIRSGMEILAQRKGLAFYAELAPDVPEWLLGDQQRLQQVTVNLIGNAIKFTEQGEVRLRIYLPDATHWTIEVSDTGVGIPPEAQAYIFEPFRQLNNAITRENRGTGLGLSITRQLVQLMGGEIRLQSQVGKGSCFTIILPLTPHNS